MTLHSSHRYRTDIDGLRAVAVLPVVFNHAGFSWMPGGFVGVDIFFVISGFLITGIILREIRAGEFSLLAFYERRVRRIFPALFVVMAVTLIAGWFLLLPGAYASLSESTVATVLFVSNIWFWRNTGDYFDAGVDFEPLLHTWSLAVEEQFYVFFPLLLWATARHPKTVWLFLVAAITVFSFSLSVWATPREPVANFYLLPTRAWELGLGALLAMGAFPALTKPGLVGAVAMAGAILIVGSIALTTDTSPFPGLGALAPCVGTALVIWAGMYGKSFVFQALSLRPVVWFGLISYSLYLWHWPILVGARLHLGSGELGIGLAVACILFSILLAWLSLVFVERPFRTGWLRINLARRHVFGLAAGGSALLVGFALLVVLQGGFIGRLPANAYAAHQDAIQFHPLELSCWDEGQTQQARCEIGAPLPHNAVREVIVWGDSHAASMLIGFDDWLKSRDASGYAFVTNACPPLPGVRVSFPGHDWGRGCDLRNDHILQFIEQAEGVHTVVLAARWPLLTEGTRIGVEPGGPMVLSSSDTAGGGIANNHAVVRRGLEDVAERLTASGKTVVLIGAVPELGFNAPDAVLSSMAFGTRFPLGPARHEFDARNGRAEATLKDVSSEFGARLLLPSDYFCETHCVIVEEDTLLYRDDDHLSAFGARWLVSRLFADFDPGD